MDQWLTACLTHSTFILQLNKAEQCFPHYPNMLEATQLYVFEPFSSMISFLLNNPFALWKKKWDAGVCSCWPARSAVLRPVLNQDLQQMESGLQRLLSSSFNFNNLVIFVAFKKRSRSMKQDFLNIFNQSHVTLCSRKNKQQWNSSTMRAAVMCGRMGEICVVVLLRYQSQ